MRLLLFSIFFLSVFATVDVKRSARVSFLATARRLGLQKLRDDKPCEPETMSAVKQCLATFYEGFGFNITQLPYADKFSNHLGEIIEKQGVEKGIKMECTIAKMLDSCLARIKEAVTCRNIPSYESMLGVGEDDAMTYLFFTVQLGYKCANEKAFLANYACMDRAWNEEFDHMAACTIEWIIDLDEHVDICYTTAGWINCMEMSFARTCGRQIYTFWCNMMELPFLAVYPNCTMKMPGCDVRPTPPTITMKSSRMLPRPLDHLRYDIF